MTRNIEPGETVQPRMSRGRWEIDGVPVGAPQTVRVDTVTESDARKVSLETPTGEICVSESVLDRCARGHLVTRGGVCWQCGESEVCETDGVSESEDCLSDHLSTRERPWAEAQEFRELNECKMSGVLL